LAAKRKKAFGKTFIIRDRQPGGEEGGKKREKNMTTVIRKKKEVI
jgi:hypothetical protein